MATLSQSATHTQMEIDMAINDINVWQKTSGSWLAGQQGKRLSNRAFRIREHAIAFGKALAFSRGANLYIRGPDGIRVLQKNESKTHRVTLE